MGVWYNQLGFYNNPFSIKPAPYHSEMFGNTQLDITLDKVRSGSVVFVDGDYGTGKTTLLKRLIMEFGGKKRLVYYSCNRKNDALNIDRLLNGGRGFFARLFGMKMNDPIMLFDEAQELDDADSDIICDAYNNSKIKSIVFVGKDYSTVRFTNGLKGLIGNNIIRLGALSDDDAVKLVRKRVGSIKLLSDDIIKKCNSLSGGIPRKLLKNCEAVCRYVVENCEDTVTEEHVGKVLG